MTFTTLEDAGKFYRNYAKAAGFSTRVRSTNRKGNEIKNQLITCSREEKWKSKISPTEKTNPTAGLNCHARIYIHTLKDVGAWIILKVVLDHSHPCCPSKSEMLKQHRELSMSIRRTIENNEEAGYSVYEVGAEVKCQCLLFESRRILCRHALSVLSFEQELTAILHRAYDNVMAEMESLKAKRKGTSSLSHEDANLESINLFDAASVVHSNSSQYQGHVMNYQFRVPAAWDNSLGV
ncbi:hypothetical protein Ahy_B01g052153 [Arachis hypogaea]|uniref:SWIM-type domain-containing protein n=1 Tax=Arachis hypogaea TaxID=3818 RepID=A0A445ANT4_ARAHY|nr:hypothetical protein Ahy_B01g052153 [Arachis hypogaea]